MQIAINRIQPASDPIRKTWDEEKLTELQQSIAEQGLIVPIKVRPHPDLPICHQHGLLAVTGDYPSRMGEEIAECTWCNELCEAFWGQEYLEYRYYEYDEGTITPALPFEVVYGHRRLEAMRRGGADEIECIVEGMDDTGVLVQALIENVQREDMNILDKAKAFRRIKEMTEWSFIKMERKGLGERQYIAQTIALLDEPEEIREIVKGTPEVATSGVPLNIVHDSRSLDSQTRLDIIEKVQEEGLNERQGIRLIYAIKAAPTPQAKQVLLKHEYSPAIHDPEHIKERARTFGAHDPLYETEEPKAQQKAWDSTPDVRIMIDGILGAARVWTKLIAEIRKMIAVGKIAPEGKLFTASKLRALARTLNAFADELETEQELEHA